MTDYEQGQIDLIQHIKKECKFIVENSEGENLYTDMLIMLMSLKPKEKCKNT